jgi:hypothetical protein
MMGKAWKIDGNFKVGANNLLSSLYFSISMFFGVLVFEILIWIQHSKREVTFRLKKKILIDTDSNTKKIKFYINKFCSIKRVLSKCSSSISITINGKFEFDIFFEFKFILNFGQTLELFNIINKFIKGFESVLS